MSVCLQYENTRFHTVGSFGYLFLPNAPNSQAPSCDNTYKSIMAIPIRNGATGINTLKIGWQKKQEFPILLLHFIRQKLLIN